MEPIEPELLRAARDWLSDCPWGNLEPEDFEIMSPEVIKAGVMRHYGGGWEQFVRDSGFEPQAPVTFEPHPRSRLSPLAV